MKPDNGHRVAITALLTKVGRGDNAAAEQLMSELYPELKRVAARIFRNERKGHTLQPTALVNEAYLRVFGSQPIEWRDRAHLFAVIARQVRRILIDHARAVRAGRRGGGAMKVSFDDAHVPGLSMNEDYVALDEALSALESEDPRAARVVELKFFGGLTESDIAEVLNTSVPTVSRDWRYARTWLFARLAAQAPN